MSDLDKVCRIVSKKLNLDYELVKQVCRYQFDFVKQIMTNEDDCHDILINGLFRFKLKPRFRLDKSREYSPHKQ